MRYRLINCEFFTSSAFTKLSGGAKLLYYSMISAADDCGFIDRVDDLIMMNSLDLKDIQELTDKGLVYAFKNHYDNSVYLIRHWFYHNKFKKGLYTRYFKLLKDNNIKLITSKYVKVSADDKTDGKLELVNENADDDSETMEDFLNSLGYGKEQNNDDELPFDK